MAVLNPPPPESRAKGPTAQTDAPSIPPTLAPRKPANSELLLATTTSTQDAGLLDLLLPLFELTTGYKVKTLAVGSGQAMALGERSEVDVLLVHAPDSEKKFMAEGHGVDRRLVMHNDFILVGPPEDPAKVKAEKSAPAALKRLAQAKALFISRGDNSGTDQLEKKLWKSTGLGPKGQTWYQETGQGMGATLNVAAEKSGYSIVDRATYLANKKNLKLEVVLEGDKDLLNVYHVISVNPRKLDKINAAGATAFTNFMTGKQTQELIARFGVEKYGQPLFFADAGKDE
ncbi:MAG: substrate-binding domain-containing protein [Chloroflexi bacterium]|nr:substrate-binding domain-containing protein [Chloroflexota bacterium]